MSGLSGPSVAVAGRAFRYKREPKGSVYMYKVVEGVNIHVFKTGEKKQ